MTLPYQVPDNDLSLNVAILILVVFLLGKTERGKLLLNNERLQLSIYLLKNPIILNNVLVAYEKPSAYIHSYDAYSVASISNNIDFLHNIHQLKTLLQCAVTLNLINVKYRRIEGFMYELSQTGVVLVEKLNGEYYDSLRNYANSLCSLNQIATKNLNNLIIQLSGEITHEF